MRTLQRRESIEDQLRACRAWCAQTGLEVVAEFEDAAISGASMANRPGLRRLISEAEAGRFNVVVTEALDRLSRSQGDVATLYEDLRFIGVSIRTIAEGEIEEMAVGLKGTMNALFLRETGRKTRRGMVGVAREGRHAGGKGLRLQDQARAEGERRVHRWLARGRSYGG